jgi:hypothetical protein
VPQLTAEQRDRLDDRLCEIKTAGEAWNAARTIRRWAERLRQEATELDGRADAIESEVGE